MLQREPKKLRANSLILKSDEGDNDFKFYYQDMQPSAQIERGAGNS